MQNDGAQPEAAVALAKEVKAFGLLDGLLLNAGQLLFSSSAGSTAEAFDTRIIMCEALYCRWLRFRYYKTVSLWWFLRRRPLMRALLSRRCMPHSFGKDEK
ncbi:hypothetical protein [Cronobacter turicensis]|uniref:hypothetical protein n=1 Tax=Cronobacter turicensis TaxID=413502 RepID=UPI0024AEA64B|nr:hypothetical protein [Cronobacter turicensis]MDI7418208.1 hypothetical protein [Cronobacter turicensis]MDI7496863.1 hypothetical protein [Cronobacter turicensis]